ncbi:MAG: hypothetical protein LBB09_00945, partial [Rickettsiales bacterium]|nr:hypothetical protein [Rickettsiales bacterium]
MFSQGVVKINLWKGLFLSGFRSRAGDGKNLGKFCEKSAAGSAADGGRAGARCFGKFCGKFVEAGANEGGRKSFWKKLFRGLRWGAAFGILCISPAFSDETGEIAQCSLNISKYFAIDDYFERFQSIRGSRERKDGNNDIAGIVDFNSKYKNFFALPGDNAAVRSGKLFVPIMGDGKDNETTKTCTF